MIVAQTFHARKLARIRVCDTRVRARVVCACTCVRAGARVYTSIFIDEEEGREESAARREIRFDIVSGADPFRSTILFDISTL